MVELLPKSEHDSQKAVGVLLVKALARGGAILTILTTWGGRPLSAEKTAPNRR